MMSNQDRSHQLIDCYDYFLRNRVSSASGIPFNVCDWYLLVGLGASALEYPLKYAAIYVDEPDEKEPVFIYVEMSEDKVMKFVVEQSYYELLLELPKRVLMAVNAVSGGSIETMG